MNFEPIGFIKSCFPDKFGTPRQPGLVEKARAELQLRSDLQPELALQGLEGFSHIWLIFIFHKNESARYHAKVHPPRLGGKAMGLFATRTPHRPNPLGLSLVELEKIEKDKLILRGIDLIDGTPVLDIKPYLPEIESIPEARTGWTSESKTQNVEIDFSEEASSALRNLQATNKTIREEIEQLLSLDPRPVVYKGFEGRPGPYRQEHRVRFYHTDIHFEFLTPQKIFVKRIQIL